MFKSLEGHLDSINLNLSITKGENGLIVSVLPSLKCKDESKKNIIPILLKGTAEELDAQFAGLIQQPLQKISGITTNIIEFEESAEKVEKQSAVEKAEDAKTKKLQDKADKEIVKAEDFVGKKEYKKAILRLKAALKFAPNYSKALHKLNEVEKLDSPVLFEAKEVKTEYETVSIGEIVGKTSKEFIKEKAKELLANSEKAAKVEAKKQKIESITETTKKPTSIKDVAIEEQQEAETIEVVDVDGGIIVEKVEKLTVQEVQPKIDSQDRIDSNAKEQEYLQENPVTIKEAFIVDEVVYTLLDKNGKPSRENLEPMDSIKKRLSEWEIINEDKIKKFIAPVVEMAVIPSEKANEFIVKPEKSAMQEMAEQEAEEKQTAFDNEGPILKGEDSSQNDGIVDPGIPNKSNFNAEDF